MSSATASHHAPAKVGNGIVPVQDVDIQTKNGRKVRIELRTENGAYLVSLQELLSGGPFSGLYAPFSAPLYRFPKPTMAFEYCVRAVQLFLGYVGDQIAAINNPCNCELLSVQQQTAVLSGLGLPITPTLKA